ncbi:unnamed protein product [Rotaria socialis]|uniref:Class II aldolase/adducin N-terminal domain-containing protein n=2 Tax=Rotaria socialis TaxID=392032 RepID=A0A817ZI74_9BILA|nr:unnamed protein product [Rotaria socialis]CAF3579977.1 unnamed protein product [Rotaria socialis]CAF4180094.1 unnamed protein product [Rotaria socialis]CAF4337502.1 unnamed protein product [Rotaria socialis]
MPVESGNQSTIKENCSTILLNTPEFHAELTNLLISEGNKESLETLSNLLLPITKLDATACKGPVLPVNDIRGIDSRSYAKNERYLRCKLASLHRVIDLYGWNCGTCSNHASIRVNNSADQFLIKPIGLAFHEITGSSLIKIDSNGSIIDAGSTTFGVNALSFSLYSFVYKHRPDINCIIHVQTPAATAVSAMKCGLLSLSQESLVCGKATTHSIDIDLTTNRLSLDANVQQSTAKILILPNYGILACGSTVEEAWHITFNLILACESQLRTVSVGLHNIILPSEDSMKQVTNTVNAGGGGVNTTDVKWAVGELEWSTLMIVLDRAGYHTGYIYREPLIRFIDKH